MGMCMYMGIYTVEEVFNVSLSTDQRAKRSDFSNLSY